MKNIFKHNAFCIFVLAALAFGCTRDADKVKSESAAVETPQIHNFGQSQVLKFETGMTELAETDKNKLREIVMSIGAGNIGRVEIASWSDKVFPKTGPDLPKADRNLAEKRAASINNYLTKELNLSTLLISNYSMAETSNWMARTFRTDEAELKSIFAKESEAPMAREDFNIILNEGGPSKAVVVFIRK